MDLMVRNTIIKMFIGMVELCIKKEIVRESVYAYKIISNMFPSKDEKGNSVAFFAADFNMKNRNNILIKKSWLARAFLL